MDPTGVLFGIDISHHQAGINLKAARANGVEFVLARIGQGAGGGYATTRDREWERHRDGARAAGCALVGYWYIGSGISPEENARLAASWIGDRSIPVALDAEKGSGDIAFIRATLEAFRRQGMSVVLTYLPRWYWQQIGQPNLNALPVLWSSRYPDNTPGSLPDEYRSAPASYWDGYGSLPVSVLQFSSSGRIPAAYGGNLDVNAYLGTRAQFDLLIGSTTTGDDFLMGLPQADQNRLRDEVDQIYTDLSKFYKKHGIAFGDAMIQMWETYANTPDINGDGKQGDVSLINWRQRQEQAIDDTNARLTKLEQLLGAVAAKVGAQVPDGEVPGPQQ